MIVMIVMIVKPGPEDNCCYFSDSLNIRFNQITYNTEATTDSTFVYIQSPLIKQKEISRFLTMNLATRFLCSTRERIIFKNQWYE